MRALFFCLALVGAGLAAPSAAAQKVELSADASKAGARIDRNIFGQFAVIRDDGRAFVEPGEFLLSVGGKQPGFKGSADASTTSFVEGRFTVVGAPTEVKH